MRQALAGVCFAAAVAEVAVDLQRRCEARARVLNTPYVEGCAGLWQVDLGPDRGVV